MCETVRTLQRGGLTGVCGPGIASCQLTNSECQCAELRPRDGPGWSQVAWAWIPALACDVEAAPQPPSPSFLTCSFFVPGWVRLESAGKLQDLPHGTKLSGNVLCCSEALRSPGGEGLGVDVQCSGELERVRVNGTMHMNQEGWR